MEQTDAELQAQFNERHENLLHSIHNMLDSLDHVFQTNKAHGDSNTDGVSAIGNPVRNSTSAAGQSTRGTFNNTGKRLSDLAQPVERHPSNVIERDLEAMHSVDAEAFESVAAKFDETFGENALTDEGMRRLE